MKISARIFTLCLFLVLGSSVSAQTQATFYTSAGDFVVEVREDLVPITANNFITLVNQKFYDFTIWHRIVPGFVIQSGDPLGTGFGGPGYTIPDEFHPQMTHNAKGALSMANAGPNTGGSQFFITLAPQPQLNNSYSVFGKVLTGMATVDAIAATPLNGNGTPIFPPVTDSIRITFTPVSLDPAVENPTAILGGNFPNPFTDQTLIAFGLTEPAQAELSIVDLNGKQVTILVDEYLPAGDHQVLFDGKNYQGNSLPAGIFIYRLRTPDFTGQKRMVITK